MLIIKINKSANRNPHLYVMLCMAVLTLVEAIVLSRV